MTTYKNEDELQHFGVLGMHWGQRSGGSKRNRVSKYPAFPRKTEPSKYPAFSEKNKAQIKDSISKLKQKRASSLPKAKLSKGKKAAVIALSLVAAVSATSFIVNSSKRSNIDANAVSKLMANKAARNVIHL